MSRPEDSKPNESDEWVRAAATLRTVVAALGERVAPAWWRTQFLTEVGLKAMRRLFPRTAILGAVIAVTEVARAEHDARIGIRGRYHLFRLPNELEEPLLEMLKEAGLVTELDELLKGTKDALLAKLDELSAGDVQIREGPVFLGDSGRIPAQEVLAQVAAFYRTSARSGTRSYPYFEAPK